MLPFPATSNDDITLYQELIRLLRTFPTPLRTDLLVHTHNIFQSTREDYLSNSSLRAQAVSFRACSRAQDLAEPSKDGALDEAFNWSITLETLDGIEAVEKGVSDFKKAIKANNSQDIALQEAFATYLSDVYQGARDESLKKYLQGQLLKVVKDVNSRGFTSTVIESALAKTSS